MNQAPQRGPVARVFTGIWDAMNFTRRLILNLLFFGLLFLVLLGWFAARSAKPSVAPLLEGTTLVIAPEGALVEQYTSDPTSRALAKALGDDAGEVQLRDLLRVIEAAGKDKRITRVVLRVDGMQFSGYASIREVAEALKELRGKGKEIIAFGESFDQAQYLLAAQADKIYLDPMGGLLLEGLSRYRQYYREGLQDKLGVDMNLFKVGEYKSAAEPYMRDAASPEAREADLFWMNDIWARYLADIAKARKLDAAALAAGIDALPTEIAAVNGDLAKYALQKKLVDGLKTEAELDAMLAESGTADDSAEGGYRQIGYGEFLTHVDMGISGFGGAPQVAVIVAEGEISSGEQPRGTIGGESTAALLREALDDEDVKAVVLRVDSPGGEVFPSEQIRREVLALKEAGKPVVVSMGDLAASGGYWISMNADRIYADPSTITGSIGIYALFPTIPRTLEKVGVRTDGVGTTRFAGAFDITRPLQPGVGEIIQSVIDKGYRDFIGRVSEARKKPLAAVDEVARGRVWTGAQAKERGLVDELGGLRTAIAEAAKRAKLGESDRWRVRYIEDMPSPFERWFAGFAQGGLGRAMLADSSVARAMLLRTSPQMERDLRVLEAAMNDRRGGPVKSLAYCFCGF